MKMICSSQVKKIRNRYVIEEQSTNHKIFNHYLDELIFSCENKINLFSALFFPYYRQKRDTSVDGLFLYITR